MAVQYTSAEMTDMLLSSAYCQGKYLQILQSILREISESSLVAALFSELAKTSCILILVLSRNQTQAIGFPERRMLGSHLWSTWTHCKRSHGNATSRQMLIYIIIWNYYNRTELAGGCLFDANYFAEVFYKDVAVRVKIYAKSSHITISWFFWLSFARL